MSAQVARGKIVTANSIWLKWNIPYNQYKFDYFTVRYRETENIPYNIKHTVENEITLNDLKSNTEYTIKVRIVIDGEEEALLINKVIRTKRSLLTPLVEQSTLLGISMRNQQPVYKLPCFVQISETDSVRDCHLVSKYEKPLFRDGTSKEKTILVVGATGSGISTLIDGMINHIVGVQLGDDFRFKAVDITDDEKTSQQHLSQTSMTTCYRIPRHDNYSIDFALNIIDTPGFNNTRGQSFERTIPIQVRKLFESTVIDLHAVCIVIPGHTSRLHEEAKAGFDNILSLFGADIKHITYPCLTFCDGFEEKSLSTLETNGIPFEKYFKFNNRDLVQTRDGYEHELWSMRNNKSFRDLFSTIDQNVPRCLKHLTMELKKREHIAMQLVNMQDRIRKQVQIINTIKNDENVLQDFKSAREMNKDFTYEKCVLKKIKNKIDKNSVNCTKCEETCHKNCNDATVRYCDAFSKGKCSVCSNNCTTDNHILEEYVYEMVYWREEGTNKDLEIKHKDVLQGHQKPTRNIQNEKMELRQSLLELIQMLENVKELIKSLNTISFRKHFSIEQYFDELIDVENEKRQDGFPARIDLIYAMKINQDTHTPLDELLQKLCI